MRTYLDCIPCFLKQALEAARLAHADQAIQKEVLERLFQEIRQFPLELSPPRMGKTIYAIVKNLTKKEDPFAQIKQKSNRLALSLYPRLKEKTEKSCDRLLTALELAIAGNVIDFGVKNSLEIEQEVKAFLNGDFDIHNEYNKPIFAYAEFRQALDEAKTILYLADNAGETVFDRIFIEQIKEVDGGKEILYAVKESPIINDALAEDAFFCGINNLARVISSGCDAPGTILEFCSKDFLKIYKEADLIISKGQGNFEALSEEKRRPIFFLFRAKCPIVAQDIGCKVGDFILKR
ncbi:MAG: DUF89 family protein [Candidatus Omnitrophica bacterium]|nr:DUF89 family protein [Candidatus Omnitrophota bacterium]